MENSEWRIGQGTSYGLVIVIVIVIVILVRGNCTAYSVLHTPLVGNSYGMVVVG